VQIRMLHGTETGPVRRESGGTSVGRDNNGQVDE